MPPRPAKSTDTCLTINLNSCKYDVLREVAERLGYHVLEDDDEDTNWDLCWSDLSVSIERVAKLKAFQRLNHFPCMLEICRKAALSRHVHRMAQRMGSEFNFYPQSLVLPDQLDEFIVLLKKNKAKMDSGSGPGTTFILKPSGGTMGRGISLVQTVAQLQDVDISNMVAQAYVGSPALVDGYKFDLRIYALVASVDPLKIYLYDEGLARLATEPYQAPTGGNLRHCHMHLTNYSINKHSAGYVDSDKTSSATKRLASVVLQQVADQAGCTKARLVADISSIVIKTIMAIQPLLAHTYHTALSASGQSQPQPNCGCITLDHSSSGGASDGSACGCPASQCFELLGFDIMFDDQLQPWLLEVNHSPSFSCDSRLDKQVKSALLVDAFAALSQRPSDKQQYFEAQHRALNERLYSHTQASGRRPLSAVPKSKQLQAAAAVLDELTNSSNKLLYSGPASSGSGSGGHHGSSSHNGSNSGSHSHSHSHSYSGSHGDGYGGSTAFASVAAPSTPPPHPHMEIDGSYGLMPPPVGSASDVPRIGRFTQIFPARESSLQKKYASILQVAADAFPDQRCQCTYCARRREIRYLHSSATDLRAAAADWRPASASGGLHRSSSAASSTSRASSSGSGSGGSPGLAGGRPPSSQRGRPRRSSSSASAAALPAATGADFSGSGISAARVDPLQGCLSRDVVGPNKDTHGGPLGRGGMSVLSGPFTRSSSGTSAASSSSAASSEIGGEDSGWGAAGAGDAGAGGGSSVQPTYKTERQLARFVESLTSSGLALSAAGIAPSSAAPAGAGAAVGGGGAAGSSSDSATAALHGTSSPASTPPRPPPGPSCPRDPGPRSILASRKATSITSRLAPASPTAADPSGAAAAGSPRAGRSPSPSPAAARALARSSSTSSYPGSPLSKAPAASPVAVAAASAADGWSGAGGADGGGAGGSRDTLRRSLSWSCNSGGSAGKQAASGEFHKALGSSGASAVPRVALLAARKSAAHAAIAATFDSELMNMRMRTAAMLSNRFVSLTVNRSQQQQSAGKAQQRRPGSSRSSSVQRERPSSAAG